MRTKYSIALAFIALLLTGCSGGDDVFSTAGEGTETTKQNTDTLRIKLTEGDNSSAAHIAVHKDENDKLSFTWEIGDIIKVYLYQDNKWYAIDHSVGEADGINGNTLSSIKIPCPTGFSPTRSYNIYGAVGNARYQTSDGTPDPILVCKHGSWRRSMEEAAKDMVLTFEQKSLDTATPSLKLKHRGNILVYNVYAGTSLTVSSIKVEEVNGTKWLEDENGNATAELQTQSMLPLTANSQQREDFACWVRTNEGTENIELRTTIGVKNGGRTENQTLGRTSKLKQLVHGRNLRIRFDSFYNKIYALGKKSGDDIAWLSSWMKDFDNNMPLSDFLLPCAHESAATENGLSFGYAKCQYYDITGLLQRGIRGLDIRVKVKNGSLDIYHGIIYQGGSLEDKVMKPVTQFLDAHPTETIVMLYKDEDGSGNSEYSTLSQQMFEKYKKYLYLYQGGGIGGVRLGDVRGKIVLITRNRITNGDQWAFDAVSWGDNEADKAFYLNHYGRNIALNAHVQDRYDNPGLDMKKNVFSAMLSNSEQYYRDGYFNFNYSSYTGGTPYQNASKMNPYLVSLIKEQKERKRGFIYMDYACIESNGYGGAVGEQAVRAIIANNYLLAQ